jgi:hypothetical protein
MLGEAAVAQEVLQRIADGRRTAFVLPARAVASNVADAGVAAVAGAGVPWVMRGIAAVVTLGIAAVVTLGIAAADSGARTAARGRPARAE